MVLRWAKEMVLVAAVCVAIGCSKRLDQCEVERQAEQVLSEYCAQEKLARTDFGGANVRPEDKYDWSVEYQSTTLPQHTLILYFKDNKIVERHRLIE